MRLTVRLLFPAAGLAIAALAILVDWRHADLNSWYCRAGFCRYDQVFAAPTDSGDVVADVAGLLKQDPGNPMVWCTYAELLSSRGKDKEAAAAFERAMSLGGNMSRVLIRAANYDLSHGLQARGFQAANRLLRQTDALDPVLFGDLIQNGPSTAALLGTAIPATPRAAQAWLTFLSSHDGSDRDVLETWAWMRQNGLADQKSAADFTWTLWRRKLFRDAQQQWADWLGASKDGYLHPERLANRRFENEPDGSPFDWTLAEAPSVEISRRDGLEVRFSGKENVDFHQVSQFATVSPGRYRFSAEISAEGITTDQGPFFHIYDAENSGRLNAQTPQVKGSASKSTVTVDFRVPSGTQAIQLQIERTPTYRFDNKIAGALHVYQVSLVPLP